MKTSKIWQYCVGFCGVLFLFSAIGKLIDLPSFAIQISYYRILRDADIVQRWAWFIVFLETFLGFCLLFQLWLKKFAIPLSVIILIGFTGLLVYAWKYLHLEDCGCFGTLIKISPGLSILKNIILIVLLGFSYWQLKNNPVKPTQGIHKSISAFFTLFLTIFLVIPLGLWSTYKKASTPKSPTKSNIINVPKDSQRPFAQFKFTYGDTTTDLGSGVYFIALLSASCDHCLHAVPEINKLSENSSFPSIFGLCLGEDSTLEAFRQKSQPEFPLQRIDPLKFFELIDTKPPRFTLVRDGKPLKSWDIKVPTATEVQSILKPQ